MTRQTRLKFAFVTMSVAATGACGEPTDERSAQPGERSTPIIENGFRCPPEAQALPAGFDEQGMPVFVCAPAGDGEGVHEAPNPAEEPPAAPEAPPPPEAAPEAPPPRDDGRDPNPPEDEPVDAPAAQPEGGRCAPRVEGCDGAFETCFACAAGLNCVPVAGDPGFGICEPIGAGARGAACDPNASGECGADLACLALPGGAFCSDVCGYTNFDCAFGFSCPDDGGLCTPANPFPEFPGGADACRPGEAACAAGENCQAAVTRETYSGFHCAPAGATETMGRCEAPTDCAEGLACVIHTGWSDFAAPENALFDLLWTGDEPHPLLGRSPAVCAALCGPELPACAVDQVCARLSAPAAAGPFPALPDAYFSFLGVCIPL